MTLILFGIPNCDTVRKARRWLEGEGLAYRFHDFRKDGLEPARLAGWIDTLGWEALINRRGMTWRQLPDADKADLTTDKAQALMLAQPTLIKRPVWQADGGAQIGFTDATKQWARRYAA